MLSGRSTIGTVQGMQEDRNRNQQAEDINDFYLTEEGKGSEDAKWNWGDSTGGQV